MTEPADLVEETANRVASLLGQPPDSSPERLSEPGRRNLILRLRLGPRPVIAKRVLAASGFEAPEARFERERESCGVLGDAAEGPHGPALLAADPHLALLVLEDLGRLPSLADALLAPDAPEAAETALMAFATRLGLVQGAAKGPAAARTLWPRPPHTIPDFVETLLPGAALPKAEVAAVARCIEEPGAFLAWTHRDPCPDNLLLTPDGARLIDFEHAGMGFGPSDAAYAAMAFPTCWCAGTLPTPTVLRFEATYREALALRRPAAAEPGSFGPAMATAGAAWLLARLAWLLPVAMEADARWGTATRRARLLHDVGAFGALAFRHAALPALQDAAERIGRLLRDRWPETEPLPAYPAFSARTRASPSR